MRHKKPRAAGVIQVFRHESDGEKQIGRKRKEEQGQDNLPVFLQNTAGQQKAGDQSGRDQERVETGDQLGPENSVRDGVKRRQDNGIKKLGKVNGGTVNG